MQRFALAAAIAVLAGCAGARGGAGEPDANAAYVTALRTEAAAVRRIERQVAWQVGAHGERPEIASALAGHEGLCSRTALDALAQAERRPGLDEPERRSLRFLRRSLAARAVAQATADLDEQIEALQRDPAFLRGGALVAAEPDAAAREKLAQARLAFVDQRLNPLLEQREALAQQAAVDAGYRDYAALSEDVREVDLRALLAQGAAYVQSTEDLYLRTLDRVAREELGVPREALRASDLPRLLSAPRLRAHFPRTGAQAALRLFLDGIGLDLKTAAGTEIAIDAEARPGKRERAFALALEQGRRVSLSLWPRGGLDGYGSLFHEAGHALHFAAAPRGPRELYELGHLAPSEAFGELFRQALADPAWLKRYDPTLTPRELAAVLRREALAEMLRVRQSAYAKIAFELELHRGAAPRAALRDSWRRLQAEATGVAFRDPDAARYLSDVDDTFYAADYARAFALAAALGDALRDRFGDDWTARRDVGPFLRRELFAQGRALSADEVAARLGTRVDFALLAARAGKLVAMADALQEAAP
jgi:hypothetical protein